MNIIKRILIVVWLICCAAVLAVYFLSCLTPYIRPSSFSFISLLALAYPIIFAAALLCTLSILFIKKGAALLLLVIVLLAGAKNFYHSFSLQLAAWQMEKTPGDLRIMTWNSESFINFFPASDPRSKDRLDMYATIQQYNPDVLCVQEFKDVQGAAYVSVKKDIMDMGYPYAYISNDSVVMIYKPNITYIGCAVFSKLPLVDSERINIRNTEVNENLIYTDVLYNKKRLRIFTGHLASLNLYVDTILEKPTDDNIYEKTYKRKRKIEYRFREGELTHETEVKHIQQYITASPYPVIYCGDNNATPASYTYNCLKGNLQDGFIEKGSGLGGTFYKISPTLRIDVCLADKTFRVKQCTVPQVYLSDHFPIVTDISWRKE